MLLTSRTGSLYPGRAIICGSLGQTGDQVTCRAGPTPQWRIVGGAWPRSTSRLFALRVISATHPGPFVMSADVARVANLLSSAPSCSLGPCLLDRVAWGRETPAVHDGGAGRAAATLAQRLWPQTTAGKAASWLPRPASSNLLSCAELGNGPPDDANSLDAAVMHCPLAVSAYG